MSWITELKANVAGRAAIVAMIPDASADGVRIHPNRLPQRAELPALVYQVISRPHNEYAHDGESGLRSPRVQWSCWGKTYDDAHDLAETLTAELGGKTLELASTRFAVAMISDEIDDIQAETGNQRVIVDMLLRQEE